MIGKSLADIAGRDFDVAVAGAGINGCSAAQQLAAAGYSVLLVDKGDFGSGSSSRSTRLIHCGLRYLAPGGSPWSFLWHPSRLTTALRMTRQAMVARSEFVTDAEARTRSFVLGFPVYRGAVYKPWQVDLALRIVGRLGPKDVPLERRRLEPDEIARTPLFRDLRDQHRLISVNIFREYQFDWPERVAMDMVLDAERMGAVVRNYTPVTGIEPLANGRWALTLADATDGSASGTVTSKVVLNTTGIWIDRVNSLASDRPSARYSARKAPTSSSGCPRLTAITASSPSTARARSRSI